MRPASRNRPAGRSLEIDLLDDTTYDLVRDSVAAAGVGLVRMERRRHRMSEVFATARGDGDGQDI